MRVKYKKKLQLETNMSVKEMLQANNVLIMSSMKKERKKIIKSSSKLVI